MTEWQPIETAPKDGTEVLLFFAESGDMRLGAFLPWRDSSYPMIWQDRFNGDAIERPWKEYYTCPTHWMPLSRRTETGGMNMDYPKEAGWTEGETSKDAAHAIEGNGRASTLRAEVRRVLMLDQLANGMFCGMTADEVAAELGESPLSVRPRISELNMQGIIETTGVRRRSSGGRNSHCWRLK